MVRKALNANYYILKDSININDKSDKFITTHTTSVRINTEIIAVSISAIGKVNHTIVSAFSCLVNRYANGNTNTINYDELDLTYDESTTYDFSNPDFDVIDENYEVLANYLTFSEYAQQYIGKTIRVKGFTVKYGSYLADGNFALGKYIVSCCVADASFGGFIIEYDTDKIRHNKWSAICFFMKPMTASRCS